MDNDAKLYIKDLTVRTKRGYLCVRVMRKWNYDGNVPGGRVFYIGLLFADEEGQAIYAQIPESEVLRLGPQLSLDQVYTIRRFNVRTSKAGYVPFDAGIMVQITPFTTITPSKVPIQAFPKILYEITPFSHIRTSGQAATKYIDVLGIVIHEDVPKTTCPKGKEYVSTLKEVTIKDLSGALLTVTLWEDHVHKFQIKDISPTEPAHSVVVLFCGCLPKKIFNKTQVNAGNACRWFLNPDIPEAQPFYEMLKQSPVPIQRAVPLEPVPDARSIPRTLEHKTIMQMNAINPYEFPEQGCKCTVRITQIPPDQEWWYMGCEVCKRRLRNNGGTYYCTKCDTSVAIPLYKLTFLAADKTGEARFFCYDVNARQIIRRNCDSLLRSVNNVSAIPEPMLRCVGRTYTLSVGLTEQSYNSMSTRAYLVDSFIFRSDLENTDGQSSSGPQLRHQSTITGQQDLPSANRTHSDDVVGNTISGKQVDSSASQLQSPRPQQMVTQTVETTGTGACQTPPPHLETEQTPANQQTDMNMSGSKHDEPKNERASVRKRLFRSNASSDEDCEMEQADVSGKNKKHAKKGKTTSDAEQAEKSDASKPMPAGSAKQLARPQKS